MKHLSEEVEKRIEESSEREWGHIPNWDWVPEAADKRYRAVYKDGARFGFRLAIEMAREYFPKRTNSFAVGVALNKVEWRIASLALSNPTDHKSKE